MFSELTFANRLGVLGKAFKIGHFWDGPVHSMTWDVGGYTTHAIMRNNMLAVILVATSGRTHYAYVSGHPFDPPPPPPLPLFQVGWVVT